MTSPVQDTTTPDYAKYIDKYVFILRDKDTQQINGVFSSSKTLVAQLLSEFEDKWNLKQRMGPIAKRQSYYRQYPILDNIKEDINVMCHNYVTNKNLNFYLRRAYSDNDNHIPDAEHDKYMDPFIKSNKNYFDTCDFTIEIIFGILVNVPIFLSPNGKSISNISNSDEWIQVTLDDTTPSNNTLFQTLVGNKYVFLPITENENNVFISLEDMLKDNITILEDIIYDHINYPNSTDSHLSIDELILTSLTAYYINNVDIKIMFGIDPNAPIYKFGYYGSRFEDDRLITNDSEAVVTWLISEGHLHTDSTKTEIEEMLVLTKYDMYS